MGQVDGDTMDGLLEEIIKGETFTVCYDEAFAVCYEVPGWRSWSIVLALLELVFWGIIGYHAWKKLGGEDERRHNTKPNDEDRLHQG